MITRAHITRRASREGVGARTVEKDYVLAHIVAAVAGLGKEVQLIFKGGAALRLCHFEDYRYSADLDFSVTEASLEDALAAVSHHVEQRSIVPWLENRMVDGRESIELRIRAATALALLGRNSGARALSALHQANELELLDQNAYPFMLAAAQKK